MPKPKVTKKTASKRTAPIDLDEEEEAEETEETEESSEESTQEAAPKPAPLKQGRVESVDLTPEQLKAEADKLVTVAFLVDRDPPPIIGHWDGRHELGVNQIKANERYNIPLRIARVLQDAGVIVFTN